MKLRKPVSWRLLAVLMVSWIALTAGGIFGCNHETTRDHRTDKVPVDCPDCPVKE